MALDKVRFAVPQGGLSGMLAWAAALAVLATTLGTLGAAALGVATGPMIIAVAAGLFFIGLMWKRS
jgi:ABC-type Mn2+/Zn2+ transport system permease subunit